MAYDPDAWTRSEPREWLTPPDGEELVYRHGVYIVSRRVPVDGVYDKPMTELTLITRHFLRIGRDGVFGEIEIYSADNPPIGAIQARAIQLFESIVRGELDDDAS